jgi:hypothetical protein
MCGRKRERHYLSLFGISVITSSGVEPPLPRYVVHSYMYKCPHLFTMSDIGPRRVQCAAASRSLRQTWG